MKTLSYSTGALGVLHRFHRSEAIAYVEGDEDVAFWSAILAKAGITGIAIKTAGGSSQLEAKVANILQDGARIIVACDSDHTPFCAGTVSHARIVRTYGYSIENTMYCPLTLNRVSQKVGRTTEDFLKAISDWYSRLEESCDDALVHDVANHRCRKGIAVFGDNCSRFLHTPASPEISAAKVNAFLLTITAQFDRVEIETVRALIATDSRPRRVLIKGHFLSHAVNRFISALAKQCRKKKVIVSDEMLYGMTVDGCRSCDREYCNEFETLASRWRQAIADVKT